VISWAVVRKASAIATRIYSRHSAWQAGSKLMHRPPTALASPNPLCPGR
jgi:hypothetical protein